jgi:hypothetical protein
MFGFHNILKPTTWVTFFNSGSKSDPTKLFPSMVLIISVSFFGFWVCGWGGDIILWISNLEVVIWNNNYKATKLQSQLAIACSVLSESWLKIPFYSIFSSKQKWSTQILIKSWLFLAKKEILVLMHWGALRAIVKMHTNNMTGLWTDINIVVAIDPNNENVWLSSPKITHCLFQN